LASAAGKDADQRLAQRQNMGLDIGFVGFNRPPPADPGIGDQPDDWVLANGGAAHVDDFHR